VSEAEFWFTEGYLEAVEKREMRQTKGVWAKERRLEEEG
jgi:hypothetical protein